MAIERLNRDFSIDQDRLKLLEQIVPEAFADGKINWETLKETLGEHLEDESPDAEHFGLTWHGKREARRLASLPSQGTLVPVPGKGVDEATTDNIFIEGDNLEVLKLLQKSYAGKVKLIYIDPPYNTGQDFIYKDDFKEPLDDYLRKTGQIDETDQLLTSNPKSSGRFHTNWLNMMYPRLRLAKNLLQDDGAIFISIDDNEVNNLRIICDEIFGEENFIASIIWQRIYTIKNTAKHFSDMHEYVLVYAKFKNQWNVELLPRTDKQDDAYLNPDNDLRGPWKAIPLQARNYYSKGLYSITNPSGGILNGPPSGTYWRVSQEKFQEMVKDNRIWWGQKNDGVPAIKAFLTEVKNGITPATLWLHKEAGTNADGKNEIRELFPESTELFSSPKPTKLLKKILQVATSSSSNDLVLDFFAGSGTTAQAVIELNQEDAGNRRFILVQLPEPIEGGNESSISDLACVRISRAINRLSSNNKEKQLALEGAKEIDFGFRVLKFGTSNFSGWQDYSGENIQEIQTIFEGLESPLCEEWSEQDVVIEILLLEGFMLNSKVTRQNQFGSNKILMAESDYVNHRLFICLDEKITDETIHQLPLPQPEDVFICLDSALTDEAKLQLADTCNIKTI